MPLLASSLNAVLRLFDIVPKYLVVENKEYPPQVKVFHPRYPDIKAWIEDHASEVSELGFNIVADKKGDIYIEPSKESPDWDILVKKIRVFAQKRKREGKEHV